jgi:hypothetical protein
VLFEEPGDFILRQRPAQTGGAVVGLRVEISGELGGDVVALFLWELGFDGAEVAIE